MKYCIFSIDDSRKKYTDRIRSTLSTPAWEEAGVWTVNGSDPEQLERAMKKWPFDIVGDPAGTFPRLGHLGIWYSVLNSLEHAPIVTFEDDAILFHGEFEEQFFNRIEELPDDADFFSLYVPLFPSDRYNPHKHNYGGLTTCRVFQPFGGVSMYYTEKGAEKFLKLVERDGMYGQWDNQICGYSWTGELNGYTSMPMFRELVRYNVTTKTIAQKTDYYEA